MPEPTDFQIIPDTEAIENLDRELRFFPTVNPSPDVLSSEQIELFNQDGYLKGIPVLDRSEVLSVRNYFDRLLIEAQTDGRDSYSISTAHLKHGRVHDLLTHPRIVSVVRDLLGENVIGWGSHFFCKLPQDGKEVAWHQDASYWPLTPSKTVTVWLAIDDADVRNACMRVIVGSHLHGHLPYNKVGADPRQVLDQEVRKAEQYGSPADIELKAGEISVHSDLLLHGSRANTSSRRRCGLTLRYSTADVHAYLGWNAKGVIVSGEDPSGHWRNAKRPEED